MSEPRHDEDSSNGSLLGDAPALVRLAAGAWWRTAGWTLETSLRAGARVLDAAVSGKPASEVVQETAADVRDYARRLRELVDSERPANGLEPESEAAPRPADPVGPEQRSLRDRGEELMRQSADVRYEEDAHPAYDRILGELAPDEGRILRFLYLEGPQPAVDVRKGKPLYVGSQLVAPGITMIGAQAGARYLERVPAYLNNLYRLGLIWFSRESLEDPLRYQVLEAQPDVVAALRGAGRGRTVRRSIHVTPFGEDFCEVCLPLRTAELDALDSSGADD